MQVCPDDMAQELIDMGKRMPIVLVNGNIAKGGFHRVYTDEGAGAALAAEHLLELGHRDIAFVGGLKELSTTMVKVRAVQKKLREHGLEIPKERQLLGSFSIDDGKREMSKLLDREIHLPQLSVSMTIQRLAPSSRRLSMGSRFRRIYPLWVLMIHRSPVLLYRN